MTDRPSAPPPALDFARVISFAATDGLPYTGANPLYVDSELFGVAARLAICQRLDEAQDLELFHCDAEWNVLAVSGHGTLPSVKSAAERRYPGIASRWVDLNVSEDLAWEYLRAVQHESTCSFCNKLPHEVSSMIGRDSVRICSSCIREFHGWLESDGG